MAAGARSQGEVPAGAAGPSVAAGEGWLAGEGGGASAALSPKPSGPGGKTTNTNEQIKQISDNKHK